MRETKQKIVVICGPTASGKTKLALQLAKELSKANILSVDSRQAYQSLDVITGKDIPSDLSSNIVVYGLNIFKVDERSNIADFTRYAQSIIERSAKEKIPLIIVGGTGLYLKAITENLSNVLIPPNIELRQKLEKLSLDELQKELKEIDYKKYSSLNRSDMMNPRRLIRHLEIISNVNKTTNKIVHHCQPDFYLVGILPDKNSLKENIHQRVVFRLANGAINEVRNLLKEYPDRKLTIYSSLGVSQIIEFIDGKINEDQMIESWANAEIDYARRQIVWFKKQPGIVWYDKDIDVNKVAKKLSKIYTENA